MVKVKQTVWHKKRSSLVPSKVLKPHATLEKSHLCSNQSQINEKAKSFVEKFSKLIKEAVNSSKK